MFDVFDYYQWRRMGSREVTYLSTYQVKQVQRHLSDFEPMRHSPQDTGGRRRTIHEYYCFTVEHPGLFPVELSRDSVLLSRVDQTIFTELGSSRTSGSPSLSEREKDNVRTCCQGLQEDAEKIKSTTIYTVGTGSGRHLGVPSPQFCLNLPYLQTKEGVKSSNNLSTEFSRYSRVT